MRNAEIIDGSGAVTTPFSSYLSLTAELGVLGCGLIVALYVWALATSLRMARVAMRGARGRFPSGRAVRKYGGLLRPVADGIARELARGHSDHLLQLDRVRGRREEYETRRL